jgi:hypothetical protein
MLIPVALSSGLVTIGHAYRVSSGTAALATGTASNTKMNTTAA